MLNNNKERVSDTLYLSDSEMVIREAPFKMHGVDGVFSTYLLHSEPLFTNWSLQNSKEWIMGFGNSLHFDTNNAESRSERFMARIQKFYPQLPDTIKMLRLRSGLVMLFGSPPKLIWTNQPIDTSAPLLNRSLGVHRKSISGYDYQLPLGDTLFPSVRMPDTNLGIAGETAFAYNQEDTVFSAVWMMNQVAVVPSVVLSIMERLEEIYGSPMNEGYYSFWEAPKESIVLYYDQRKRFFLQRSKSVTH